MVTDNVTTGKKKPDKNQAKNENTHKNYLFREAETALVQFIVNYF